LLHFGKVSMKFSLQKIQSNLSLHQYWDFPKNWKYYFCIHKYKYSLLSILIWKIMYKMYSLKNIIL
jgi:hypothetical protein